jgi:large subunit ribosomal protein L13
MKTTHAKTHEVQRRWYVVDAQGKVLGRLASQVASVLRGKHKPSYTPHADTGDFVVVINADKVKLTGKKADKKLYQHHTDYPGMVKTVPYARMMETFPERVVEQAVAGMLPRGPLARHMLTKLKIYAGTTHPHAAQKPEPLALA